MADLARAVVHCDYLYYVADWAWGCVGWRGWAWCRDGWRAGGVRNQDGDRGSWAVCGGGCSFGAFGVVNARLRAAAMRTQISWMERACVGAGFLVTGYAFPYSYIRVSFD